jgi:AP-3 complex subunit beta
LFRVLLDITNSCQTSIVKLQIITLAAKLVVLCPSHETLASLSNYVFALAKYDLDYDVRDRARMLTSLLTAVTPNLNAEEPRAGVILRREQVKLVLFEGKGVAAEESKSAGWFKFLHLVIMTLTRTLLVADENAVIGYLGVVTGKWPREPAFLSDWLEEGTESSLRDTEEDTNRRQAAPATTYVQRPKASQLGVSNEGSSRPDIGSQAHSVDLEKFYADDSDDDEHSSSQDESSSGETEESDGIDES